MSSGTLTAVLKFHRNLCYDDLLVNWPTTDAQAVGCRSPDEEIVISVPLNNQQVPFATVDSPNGPELTFDFSTRNLPINAWDVVLQVAYQGMLGGESNAVVLATTDVSEPTFVSFMNTTDYVMLNGNFYQAPNLDQSLFG